MSITMAYYESGKEIALPRVGRKMIPSGSMICKGGEWETLAESIMIVRTSEWDCSTQSHINREEIRHVGL